MMPERTFWRAHPLASHLLVLLQLTGVMLSCWPPTDADQQTLWLLIICIAGGLLGFWALWANPIGNFSVYPEPRRETRLIQHGPYRHIRHPMYLSLILMMLGIALYNLQWHNALGFAATVLAVGAKARREEILLEAQFGAAYLRYRTRSWHLLPGIF